MPKHRQTGKQPAAEAQRGARQARQRRTAASSPSPADVTTPTRKATGGRSPRDQGSGAGIRRRPLIALCERSGWQVQHLNRQPAAGEELADLCVRELIACREAGELTLTISLADAALEAGLTHPRITANRERAQRALKRGGKSLPSDSPAAPAGIPVPKRGLRSRLQNLFAPAQAKKLGQPKGTSTSRARLPKEQSRGQILVQSERLSDPSEQLKALLRVCREAAWTPQGLDASASEDVALACGKEMQRCRLAGRHALVVALGAEAGLLGLAHQRIQHNLELSQGKAQLENLREMLKGNLTALVAAERLLLNALIEEPKNREYRQLLEECIARQLEQDGGPGLQNDLRRATVNLELNQRLLKAIECRRAQGAGT
jgi:hypothetical protein